MAARCIRLMARRVSAGQKADGHSQRRWRGAERLRHHKAEPEATFIVAD